jgi:hypothetical protein
MSCSRWKVTKNVNHVVELCVKGLWVVGCDMLANLGAGPVVTFKVEMPSRDRYFL